VTTTSAPPRRSINRPGWLDTVVDQWGSLRAVAVMRVVAGVIVIRHLWPDVWAATLPVDRFHVPWWSWLPVPSHAEYRALLYIGVAAGTCMVVGVASRIACVVSLAVVSYLLFVDMTGFAHNRAFLVWMLVGLSLVPARREGYVWPLYLMRMIVSSVYLTSASTKLFEPDWRSGLVLWDRVVRYQGHIPFGGWLHDVLTTRGTYVVLAPAAIALELFIGVGLWHGRTRLAAVWVAIAFHTSIEIAANVQTFSYSAIAALLIWVTPQTRDRVLIAGPRLCAVVSQLDWMQRFRLVADERGRPVKLVDRDGTVRHGRDAVLTASSRLPLLFVVVAPWLAIHRLRRRSATRAPVALDAQG
jgi:hypothetical protein